MKVRPPDAPFTQPAVAPADEAGATTADIEVGDPNMLLQLTGPSASRLSRIEQAVGVSAGLRGQIIRLRGTQAAVALAERMLLEM